MDNILQKIESIEINPSIYGEGIEDRFKVIDSNFDRIIKTNYLTGKVGNNTGVTVCLIEDKQEYDIYWPNGEKITPHSLRTTISDAIKSIIENYEEGDVRLNPIGENEWNENINGSKVVLYHEVIDGKKIIVSSLPYIYIDPRFSNISSNLKDNYENLLDISGAIYYDAQKGEFVHIQSFPTIYYDKNIGDGNFCWNINGKKTGIICQGPQGEPGTIINNTTTVIPSGDTIINADCDTLIINDSNAVKDEIIIKYLTNGINSISIGHTLKIMWRGNPNQFTKIKLYINGKLQSTTGDMTNTNYLPCNIYCVNDDKLYEGATYLIGDTPTECIINPQQNGYIFTLTCFDKENGVPTWWIKY